jgi:UDP-N-acetylglucosamine:LPS N-acetylglucosamine transferase
MFKNRPKVILLVYGKGGHSAQMARFLKNQPEGGISKNYVALTNDDTSITHYTSKYFCIEARDKYTFFKNFFISLAYFFISLIQTIRILSKFNVQGFISTGPGMAVVPAIICRLFGIKVVYFESWSRFYTPAIAGQMMYRIAHLFFIQHKSIQRHYPKAVYTGRL